MGRGKNKNNAYNNHGNNYNNNYNNNNNYGAAYGDPHFMISSESQPSICFDFTPEADSEFTLLSDASSGLKIEAHSALRLKHETHRHIVMDEVKFTSPEGRVITFDIDGVHLSGSEENASGKHQRSHVEVGDAVFMVRGNARKESMAVAVVEPTGLSAESTGIIGQFLRADAYTVEETDSLNAIVKAGGMTAEAEKKPFHQQLACWVVEEDDVLNMIANI